MKRAGLFLLFASALVPAVSHAQVQTGTPPFGTFAGGPDVIDLANLNVHLDIPVVQRRGRGTDFTYDLGYDSSVWNLVSSGGTNAWTPVENWGWRATTEALTGYVTYHEATLGPWCTYLGHQYGTTLEYDNWTYHDPWGAEHYFAGTTYVYTGAPANCNPYSTSMTATANDDSGYTLTATGGAVKSLLTRGGTFVSAPLNTGTGSGGFTDRNGNQISVNNNVFTDTLGTTVLTVSGSGTPSSPIAFTYTAPSGAAAPYTLQYKAYTVKTNFQCSGISEFGPTTENLVSEIDLPDTQIAPSDKYTITYEATPGEPNDVTGRIASITLPTGGVISYSYEGITCSDGTTPSVTRTTPDGTWTYAHSESGTAWTTTVTDPQGNKIIYDFQGIYQTERKVYQGSSTLLEDDVTCYNGSTQQNCNSEVITLPITERIATNTLGNQQCKHVYFYNSYGLLIEQDDYDYGSGAPGPLLRKELIAYAPLGNNIVNAPSQIKIENGSGTVIAETNYTYDQGSVTQTSAPQHVSVSGSRGNPTTVSYLVGGSTFLSKTFTYYDTGNVDVATDVNGAQTGYTYGACGSSFQTSVSEPLSLSRSMTWNCTGGVETSATDENGQTVSSAYTDAYFWRPATSADQENNVTNFYYQPNASYSSYEIARYMTFNGGTSEVGDFQYMDGLGRTYVDQHPETAGGSTLDSISYAFDSNGRLASTSGPCAIAYAGTCSGPTTTQTYDALNRSLVTTDGGGGTVTLSYTGNDVLQALGPAPSGENTKRRQSEYNSIGQLTSVCEITSASGSGTCSQTTSATGYWTKYTYDALGDLTGVSQNAQSSQVQTRSYTYDDLGRMTSETNPETGTINYVYDSDATCGTSDGDLVKKTDAAGNVTCYAYDALHRVTSITYPSGPNSGNTPSKHFIYDAATVDGNAMSNAKTRLAEAYTCTSSCTSKITDEGFNYTARGEVATVYESTPHSGGYFWVSQTYWANGALEQENNNLGNFPNFTYGVDGEGRSYSVSANSGQNPVTSTTYNAASEATQVNFGSGDNDAFQFDTNTFRMTQYKYSVNSQSVVGNLTWNANGTLNKLAITDPFDSANTQTCAYSYDDLARIASGNCGSVWSQTFSYDAFGNITKSGSEQFQPGYNLNNQMTNGTSYDAMGDVLNDGLHSYAWNSDTRPTTIDTSITVTYDALGRMVEQSKSGTNTEIVYDCLGNKLALMNGATTLVKAFASLPGGGSAVYNASGLQYYRHPDWLGSSRFSSTPSRTMYNDLAYAPFGETYAESGSTGVTDISFAGNNEDTTTNLYDAYYREYGIQGRWPSPDPAGIAAANPANPQSWNRYAYVMNNPLLSVDPLGLDVVDCPDCGGSVVVNGYVNDPLLLNIIELQYGNLCMAGLVPCAIWGNETSSKPALTPPQKQSYADCVKNLANVDSIQNLTHAGNGFLASAFLSNTFSSFIQLGQDISAFRFGASGNDIAQAALSNGLGPLAQNAAQNVPNVAVSATAVSITASENGFQATTTSVTASLPFGNLAQAGAGVLADVFTGKTIYDAGIALGASAVCAIPGIR